MDYSQNHTDEAEMILQAYHKDNKDKLRMVYKTYLQDFQDTHKGIIGFVYDTLFPTNNEKIIVY